MPRPETRTESVTCKVTPGTRTRLLLAVRRLGLPSMNEAVNRAILSWLEEVEPS